MFHNISIVIPLYNKEDHIERAIESVLAQTYENFELIIVDDGSTDNSLTIAENYHIEKIVIIKQANGGVSKARNTGIAHAKFDYIAFLDADDEWKPEFLSTINKLINLYPEAGTYSTSYYIKEPGRKTKRAVIRGIPKNTETFIIPNYFKSIAKGNSPVWTSASCVAAHVFESIGGFPENVKLYEDLYVWTKVALNYEMAFSYQPMSIYHKEASNRACNNLALITEVPAFEKLFSYGKREENNALSNLYYKKLFVGKYALIDALKMLYVGEKKTALVLSRNVCFLNIKQAMGKVFILISQIIPKSVIKMLFSVKRKLA